MRRAFHTTARLRKNPYYFYDLAKKQPKQTFDPGNIFANENVTAEERIAKVFGSVATRDASRREQERKARLIAGVKVPAKPEEPTNCCMSGCVNCVWEQYKDEIEDWRYKRTNAKEALLSRPDLRWPEDFGPEPERGTNASPSRQIIEEDDTWEDMPISIKVFVETEKKLREQRQHNASQPSA